MFYLGPDLYPGFNRAKPFWVNASLEGLEPTRGVFSFRKLNQDHLASQTLDF